MRIQALRNKVDGFKLQIVRYHEFGKLPEPGYYHKSANDLFQKGAARVAQTTLVAFTHHPPAKRLSLA